MTDYRCFWVFGKFLEDVFSQNGALEADDGFKSDKKDTMTCCLVLSVYQLGKNTF